MFKWVLGRQNTGYWKMKIFQSKWLRCDIYLLKFEDGVEVPWHVDPAKTGRHYRFNLYIKCPHIGGNIVLDGPAIFNNRLFHFFRPDIVRHCMTKVQGGTLYMLSFGKVI